MDLMYIIFMWLKKIISRMGIIASFIGGSFLPGDELDDDLDSDENESGVKH
ncbi:MAG: hypothetical protein IJO73_00080 [Clostridia bacterium]|nr:hypothetical protein [Clostridia bacterium]